MELQVKFPKQVIALMGNHELYLLEDYNNRKIDVCEDVIKWLKDRPYFYETQNQIFVHSGIDEEAEEYWKIGTEEIYYCNKYPHTTGYFFKTIISGHISAREIAKREGFAIEDGAIFFDGKSHYYIDGEVENTNKLPILMYDTLSEKYIKM